MASTLRLPPALEADARARCERLGISLNALVCVALDSYLGRIDAKGGAVLRASAEPMTARALESDALPPAGQPALRAWMEPLTAEGLQKTSERFGAVVPQPGRKNLTKAQRKTQAARKR